MTLTKYQSKRKFEATPEPRGQAKPSRGRLKFVVQKHAASHLHYDFRLEMEGVLKSWAVPKGPSLDPSVKRLAVMVEDHPLDYLKFEGTIPAGNYGAGEVLVWDIGTYWDEHGTETRPDEAKLLAGLAAGKLIIYLKGKKLNGLFDMVQMKGRGEHNWLLFKKQDEFASTTDVTKLDGSAISRKHLQDPTASGGDAAPRRRAVPSSAPAKTKASSGKAPAKAKIPFPLKPMLATLVDAAFDDPGWIFEVKWDGYRAIGQVERDGKAVKLYSRNGNSFADKYPDVVTALGQLGQNCVVDGEIVALAAGGKSAFQLLQSYGKTRQGQLRYVVFDLLFLDGYDVRGLPLLKRKQLLKSLLTGSSKTLVYGDHVAAQGVKYFAAADRHGLEGIIAKRADATYHTGQRTTDWLKVKTHQRQEAVIAGFTQPRGSRQAFGALILGVYAGKRLRYIGHTGTGFDERTLRELHARLTPLVTKSCPFKPEPKTNMPATWVKPKLLCEVQFSKWTSDGQMRHPVFIGLREDKPATQVHVEVREPVAEAVGPAATVAPHPAKPGKLRRVAQPDPPAKPAQEARVTTAKPRAAGTAPAKTTRRAARQTALPPLAPTKAVLTHLDKEYWPGRGITKGDLLAYYGAVAPTMLPYLKDRPQSLHRYPGGVGGQAFFQKDVNFQLPPFMRSAQIHSESNNAELTWALCQNRDTLLFLANLGCIEINPWNSRVRALDRPDWTVLDLDPDTNSFDEVIGVAKAARQVLDKLEIDACCKTSGQTGLHIFIPLGAKYSYAQARQFTLLLARQVQQLSPDNTSLERAPAKRRGLIYLDYLQNSAGQTLAAPYSVRPAPAGAQVSTPLKWSELRAGFSPAKFDIFNTLRRLDKVGDLWQPVLGRGIDMAAIARRMGGAAEEALAAQAAKAGAAAG